MNDTEAEEFEGTKSECCKAEAMRDDDYPAEVICSECGNEFVDAPSLR